MIQQWHRLDSLTEAHLISQDNVAIVLESSKHPVKSSYLIVFAFLTKAELWHEILLEVVLEVAFALSHAFKFEQFGKHLTSL